jgi:hypothetical protein
VERGEVRTDLEVDELALLFTGMCELALALHWGGGWPALEDIPKLLTSLFLSGGSGEPAL